MRRDEATGFFVGKLFSIGSPSSFSLLLYRNPKYTSDVSAARSTNATSDIPTELTAIQIETDLLPALLWFPGQTYVSIDNKPDRMPTRNVRIAVTPGWHTVQCFIRPSSALRFVRAGNSSTRILVPERCIVSLCWHGPIFLFQRGRFNLINSELDFAQMAVMRGEGAGISSIPCFGVLVLMNLLACR